MECKRILCILRIVYLFKYKFTLHDGSAPKNSCTFASMESGRGNDDCRGNGEQSSMYVCYIINYVSLHCLSRIFT